MIKRHSSELMDGSGMKLRMYERLWPNRIEQLKAGNNAENLGLYMNESLDLFFENEANQQEKDEILKYLRQALTFGVANFMYANYPDKEFSFVVEGNEITLKGGTDGANKHSSIWMKAIYMAIILRANNRY